MYSKHPKYYFPVHCDVSSFNSLNLLESMVMAKQRACGYSFRKYEI